MARGLAHVDARARPGRTVPRELGAALGAMAFSAGAFIEYALQFAMPGEG